MSLSQAELRTALTAKRHHNWWLIILLVVCVPAVIVGNAFSDGLHQLMPETIPNPSSYNLKASGYSALYQLANKVGLKTQRWESAYRNLDKQDSAGTMVIVLPWEPLSKGDLDHLLKWVKSGNDLVYLDYFTFRTGHRLLEALKLESMTRPQVKAAVRKTNDSIAEAAYAPELVLSGEATLSGGQPVVGAADRAYLTVVRYGQGRCLIGTVPELCANRFIANPAYKTNFQFMSNWFASSKQPIIFDEKCHGYSSNSNVFFYVLRSPVGFVILQLIILFVVAFLSLNQRFGAAQTLAVIRKISNLEFIDGMAATYRRARARDTAWAMIFHPLKARLCKSLGVAPDAPMDDLAGAWAESSGNRVEDCRAFLSQAQSALERRNISDHELRELISSADSLTSKGRELAVARRFTGA